MYVWGMILALITLLDIFSCILLHVWPPEPLSHSLVGRTFPSSVHHKSLHATQPGVQQHHLGEVIIDMDLQMISDTISYPQITINEPTFSASSLPLSYQSVEIHQSERKHKGPSNLAQMMRPRLRLGNALCSVALTALQKSFVEHIHSMTRPKLPMSQHDYSDFLVL